MPPKPPDVPPALAKALQLHQQGKLAEAERLYAEILAAGTSAGARSPITLLNHGRALTETIAQTLDDYVSMAVSLGADPAKRQAVGRNIADSKHRIYRDRTCITALENFLDRAARRPTGTPA